MKEYDNTYNLPFFIPSRDWREFMKIGSLIEELISLKDNYDIRYPDDNIINIACNILENFPNQQMTVKEWIEQNKR